MSDKPEVRVGQVWQDKDRRMGGRRVRVTETVPHGFTRYVSAVRPEKTPFRSRTARFRTAFLLVSDAP